MAHDSLIPTSTTSTSGRAAAREPTLVVNLPRRVHLLGAGGAGLSGAARLLVARGHVLSGHDREASPFVELLRGIGVEVCLGQSVTDNLPPDAEAVVRSAAVPAEDPQLLEAVRRGLPVLKYSDLLGRLAPPRRTLAVAGTHGKTTSTWMLLHALEGIADAGSTAVARRPRPGALVGGAHRELRTNALAPEADGWFAVEACEYDRSFLKLAPRGALVTNVEADHLDYYGDLGALEEAFARFVGGVHTDGLLVVGRDVPDRVVEQASCAVWRLGRELSVDLLSEQRGRFELRVRGPGWASPPVRLALPGTFNVDNAALALALAVGLAAREERVLASEAAACAAHALRRFPGVSRRFESWGTIGGTVGGSDRGVEVVHDYAHHPTEVAVTLEAARRVLPGRPLHVLFQPHQHSRTARFLADFVEVLRGADRVVVADVYGARKHIDSHGAGAEELVRRLVRAGVDAVAGGPPLPAARVFAAGMPARAAALVLGAGDIDGIRDELFDKLALRRDR